MHDKIYLRWLKERGVTYRVPGKAPSSQRGLVTVVTSVEISDKEQALLVRVLAAMNVSEIETTRVTIDEFAGLQGEGLLILFSDSIADVNKYKKLKVEEGQQKAAVVKKGQTVVCLPSLEKMLEDPQAKLQAWGIIKEFMGREKLASVN
jgi:hypothetical protein